MSVSITITPVENGVQVVESSTIVTSSTIALGSAVASAMTVVPVGNLTATNVQTALEDLASTTFQQNETPSGAQVTEGDTWYDLDDNQYKVYRETSPGTFQWVPIIVGSADGDSDTLDAGAF